MSPGRICAVLLTALLIVSTGSAPTAAAQPFVFDDYLTNLPGVDFGAVSAADLDQDGRYEILVTGRADSSRGGVTSVVARLDRAASSAVARSYELTDLPVKLWATSMAWTDFDHDGRLDLALLGAANLTPPYQGRFVVLRGSEEGLQLAAELAPLHSGSVTWIDWDQDGQDELVGTGISATGQTVTRLYDRNEEGDFVEQPLGMPGYAYGKAHAVDYDSDGDEELFLMGAREGGRNDAALYFPDEGSYASLPFEPGSGGRFGSFAAGEIDGNGLPDLLMGGGRLSSLYHVAGMSRHEQGMAPSRFDGVVHGAAALGDVNLDGAPDLLQVGGTSGAFGREGGLYSVAPATDSLALTKRMTLPPLIGAQVHLADEDGDGDLDLLLAGQRLGQEKETAFYRNESAVVNRPPEAPSAMQGSSEGAVTTLSWEPPVDDHTGSSSLSYAVVIGTSPGARDVVSPLARLEDGRRLAAAEGNAGWAAQYRIRGLAPGTYYWRVQAIDGSYRGSAFSQEKSVVVEDAADKGTPLEGDLPARFALSPASPTPFTGATQMTLELPRPTPVTVRIYDMRGALVDVLAEEVLAAGTHPLRWSGGTAAGGAAASGVYLIHVEAGSQTASQRVVLLR